jgi:hypothetical protein
MREVFMKLSTLPVCSAFLAFGLLACSGSALTATPVPTAAVPTAAVPTAAVIPQSSPTPVSWLCISAQGDGVYLRSEPELEKKIRVWPDGTRMLLVEQASPDWLKVQAPDASIGFMPRQYLVSCEGPAFPPTPVPTSMASATPKPVPTSTPAPRNLTFGEIASSRDSMTDLQWKAYEATIIGKRILWNCTVSDVTEDGKVIVHTAPEPLMWSIYLEGLPKSVVLGFNKGKALQIEGTIKSISGIFGFSYLTLVDVVLH